MEGQRFWIEAEPQVFRRLRRKDLEGFKRALEAGVEHVRVRINAPYDDVRWMEVLYVECAGDPDSDVWVIDARLLKDDRVIRVEWDPESEEGMVETGMYLAECLEDFAERCDLLPPEDRSVDGTEVIELSELSTERFFSLANMILYVGQESGELCYHVAIYGDGLDELLRVNLPSINSLGRIYPFELPSVDANQASVTKFVYPDLPEYELASLSNVTRDPTFAQVDVTVDVTVFWPYAAIQQAS